MHLNTTVRISIKISLKFVPKYSINNIPGGEPTKVVANVITFEM